MKIYLKLVKVLKFSFDTYVLGEGNMKVNSKSEQRNPKILRNIIALQLFANANSFSFSCLITWRL